MWAYIICAVIWVCIFGSLIPAIRKRNICEICAHCGVGLFFTSLVLGLSKIGILSDILWLQVVGFVLYLPAALLVISSHIALKRRGKPENYFGHYSHHS